MQRGLWTGFLRSAAQFGDRPAVFANGRSLTYSELQQISSRIAATIQAREGFQAGKLTAVFAHRTTTAFSGVLGALLAGTGYVPLNRTFPVERTKAMFDRSGCRSIIVDSDSLPQLDSVLSGVAHSIQVILPDCEDVAHLARKWPQHSICGLAELADEACWEEPVVERDAVAYLLFTSGSTGIPKGVVVAQRNVIAFLDYMLDRYNVTENDRFSQMFDMTFDLSVFDMFMCWERGGYLCCPSQKAMINPGKFIQDNQLTIWFSVPSTLVFMKQFGMLKTGRYPTLRLSLFCGEPLPVPSAVAWADAAPNSIVENLYGPTELTIACTLYRWDSRTSPSEAEMDIVPIGYPYPGMKVLVADDELKPVGLGEEGELLMNGPQMCLGYWQDPSLTAAAFVKPRGLDEIYYRTGDRVRRQIADGPLTHLGRIDFQVKILGHRVELGEVEAKVRRVSGLDGVVAVGWPRTPTGFGGIEVFVEGTGDTADALRRGLEAELPDYMMPRRIHFMARLPRNVNDKFDRKAMSALLERGL